MQDNFKYKYDDTFTATIFVAGPYEQAAQICQRFCLTGLCVSIKNVEFIYTGGRERGVEIGLINYPRFPSSRDDIVMKATSLAEVLIREMSQGSATVVASDKTYFISRRIGDE